MTAAAAPRRARSFRERRSQPSSSSSSSSGSLNSTAGSTLAGNFQTFLTLLTTQLQNQNPLDPLDTNQFTQQLVQFAERRAAAQDQRSADHAGVAAADRAIDAGADLRRQDRGGRRLDRDHDQQFGHLGSQRSEGWQRQRLDHQQHRTDRLLRQLRRQRRQQSALRLGRQGHRRHAVAGRPVQNDRHRHRHLGQFRGDFHPDPGRGQFGRSHPIAAVAVDQRPDLHGQPDQGITS